MSPCGAALGSRGAIPTPVSARRDREGVAQENGAFGGDQVSGLDAFEDLVVAVARQADLDGALGEAAAVGGDPDGHRAVALTNDAIQRNGGRADRPTRADPGNGEHARAQPLPWGCAF